MKIDFQREEITEMTEGTVDVVSTSMVTADASPIVLDKKDSVRLRFLPKLVDNKKNSKKSVSGKIVYERKRKDDKLFPSEDKISRKSVKAGEMMEINLNTSETYELYQGLKGLYELYEGVGTIPYGKATYARIDSTFSEFISIIQKNPTAAKMIGNEENYGLVKILLEQITATSSIESLKKGLSDLEDGNLQKLTSSLNLEKLRRIVDIIRDNLENSSEEFWQTEVFKANQWVLAQIFACPCTIFAEKAYVGGKGIDNTRGNICDFIYKNSLSQNVALIEIKTPCTKIIGDNYRGTYSFSLELSGAINQVLNYRDKLTKEYLAIHAQSGKHFEALNPKCILVIGKLSDMEKEQIAAFENFRNSLNNVSIITFDEIYQRIVDLVDLFTDD